MQKNRFFLTCIAFLIFSAQAAWAGKIIDEAHIRSLLTKADKVPVIVTFKVNKYQELAGKSAARTSANVIKGQPAPNPDAVLRTAIRGTADGLLQNLPAKSFNHKRTFSVVPGIAVSVNEAALQALANNPRVEKIVEDRPEKLPPITINTEEGEISAPQLNHSTPLIGADDAWSLGYTGEDVFVAVLDTGVLSSHEMFAGKTFIEACFGTNRSSDVVGQEYDSSPVCPNGQETEIGSGAAAPNAGNHGTHVSGIAAGNNLTYTPGEARRGVAYDADIIAVQVFSEFISEYYCGDTDPCYLSWGSDQIAGLEYVYSLRGSYTIAAVNMSLGGGQYTSHCDTADAAIIDQLRNAGIATVIATGNDGFCGAIGSPACVSSAIAVGASDKNDVEASYNNYHPTLQEFFAPGSAILSALASGNSTYASWNGTSMATPHVAGAIAVLKEAFPNASVRDFEKRLRKSGTPLTGLCPGATSIPRINVVEAINTSTFPWPAFLAAITGNTSSEWGAANGVCCHDGWASFNLTAGGVTKHSILSSCNTNVATWEGWQSSTAGNKQFTWTLTSDGCGSLSGSFNYALEKEKQYQFYPSWTGSSVLMNVRIYEDAKSTAQPQSTDTVDLQNSEMGEGVLSLPLNNFTGAEGSWQQCAQP